MKNYFYLMRLHKPIGILLLLWPTLWGLWLASNGKPAFSIVSIFIVGVILMRSAGCIINDIADRHVDKYVERTKDRPITAGNISVRAALTLFVALLLSAFMLVLFLNKLTIALAFIGAFLAIVYPFMKRFTYLPQVGLGFSFAWGIPMAFSAIDNKVPVSAWILFLPALIWPVIYDTMYAMVDKKDDIKVGIKSTAILFGNNDRLIIGVLQALFVVCLILVGALFKLNLFYYLSVLVTSILFLFQQRLIFQGKNFQAFLNNQWVGMVIFLGIISSYSL